MLRSSSMHYERWLLDAESGRQKMPATAAITLRADRERVETALDRLQEIADGLDQADAAEAATLFFEADQIVAP